MEYHYFRHQGVYQRLPGAPGSAEYLHRYADLLAMIEVKHSRAPEGSVRVAVNDFKASAEFEALAPKTRRDYDRMLALLDPIGDERLCDVKRHHIRLIWDHLKEKPRTAKLFAQVASRLFSWAIDRGLVDINPAAKIKRVGRPEPHRAWSNAECAAFEAACPDGYLMTAYRLAHFTGQRQGDVLKMARTAYDGTTIAVRQGKTGASLRIPAHRDLRKYLDSLPVESVLFVASGGGHPVSEHTLRHQFREVLDAAGLSGITFHGLRATAASRLAEAGCPPHQIAAITGHKSLSMVEQYTRGARQDILGKQAIERLEDHRNNED